MATEFPDLLNGDTNYMYVESFLQLSSPLPPEHDTAMSQKDVDQLASYFNSEVNLMLAELGFTFPIGSSETDAINWIRWTKTLATAAYTLQGLAGQSGDEVVLNRATQFFNDYTSRLTKLVETNGEFLGLPVESDGRASRVPVALKLTTSNDVLKNIMRKYLRFEQLQRVERYENEQKISDSAPSEWLSLIRGV